MNYLTCPVCNINYLPYETHYCTHYPLPSNMNTTNSGRCFSIREKDNAQATPSLSDEVYHQNAIYNSGFGNIGSYVEIETSESQEETELNSDSANMTDGSNGTSPPFGSTDFSGEHGKCNDEMPNANQSFTSICESASAACMLNEECTVVEQIRGSSYTTDRKSDVDNDNSLNDYFIISNNEQTSANIASVRQSPTGSNANENSGFGTLREEHDSHASDSNSKKIPFVCPVCKKKFPFQSKLQEHSVVHSAEKPFICDVCGKSFRLKQKLKAHKINLGHNPPSDASSSRENSCSVCGKVFPFKSHLEQHAKMHTGKRPFICGICRKAFKHTHHLTAHSLLHSEPK